MKVYGVVYLLIDGTNDMEYVGQTTRSVEERFKEHAKTDSYIGRAIRAHGADMFVIVILKVCYSKEELDYWERRMIRSRDTKAPNGYNLTDGGEGTAGYSDSDETRAKKCLAKSGANHHFYGKHLSDKHRTKLKAANAGEKNHNFGKHHTAEECAELSVKIRNDSPYKNLIGEMETRQFTYNMMAQLLGLSIPTISGKMCGTVKFTSKDVSQMVAIFNKPAEYLMARDDGEIFSLSRRHKSPFKNLVAAINEKQFTYIDLAEHMGISKYVVSCKMRGINNFTVAEVTKLLEIFQLPAEYLLLRDDGETFSLSRRYKSPFKNLLATMSEQKLTYTALAEYMGLSQQDVSGKMLGKYKFTAKDIAKLVEIFGLPAEYLMARDDEKK